MAGKRVSAPVVTEIEVDEWGEIIETKTVIEEEPAATIGDNAGPAWDDLPPSANTVIVGDDTSMDPAAVGRLRTLVQRIERLDDELDGLKGDRKEVFLEAKGEGFDTKILAKVIALRKQDKAKVQVERTMLDLYQTAIEGLPG